MHCWLMYFHNKLICGMEKMKCNSQFRGRDVVQFDFLEFVHTQNNFAYFGKVLFKYIVNGRQSAAATVLVRFVTLSLNYLWLCSGQMCE